MGQPAAAPASTPLADGRRRLCFVGIAFSLAFASVGLRLLDMVDWRRGVLMGEAVARPDPADADGPPPARAEITDRHGVLLAANVKVPSLYADPAAIADKDAAARMFASALEGVDAVELAARLKAKRRFAWVKHQVTPDERSKVLELGIPGIGFRDTLQRVYPKRHLASHVVGFVDIDGRGLAGVERALDDRLAANGRSTGKGSLALGLDLRVQQIVREELLSAFVRFRAKGASGLVIDGATGEVVAMVSLPDFDPNRPDQAGEEQRLNRVTGGTYELGSLFKIFTAALALESGQVSIRDRFDATEPLKIGGFMIRDDHAKKRPLTVPECFVHSSNICTAKMAVAAGGSPAMQDFFKRLGFYDKPDIELPQPELGNPQTPKRWADVTTATVSFGHGIAVSPFQFADAVAGLVGGQAAWPRPTLVRHDGAGGEALPARPAPVKPLTAAELRWLMWLTVEKGTGMLARQPAYLVGGKTGTADKAAEKGQGRGYRHGAVLASFVGVFPIERPRYVVLAVLDEPHGDKGTHGYRYGGWTAAPVVGAIVDRVGPLLGVRPSEAGSRQALFDRLVVTKAEGRKEEDHLAALGSAR